jgi:site-specific recombinase XerD
MAMEDFSFRHLSDFMEQLSNRDLSATTVHQHMVAIRKIFAHAHGNATIKNLPKFPVIKVADKPRLKIAWQIALQGWSKSLQCSYGKHQF